jgi:type I restriction enzyme, R subunit
MTPEARARQAINALLMQADWHVCNMGDANIYAALGLALRDFPLNIGYGFADYLLFVDGNSTRVVEAKKERATLTGTDVASARYV